jgi:hypothetical protein
MFPGTFSPRALFLGCPVALSAVIFVVYLESGHVGFGHSTSPVESRLQCLAQKSVELCLRTPHVNDTPAVRGWTSCMADDTRRPDGILAFLLVAGFLFGQIGKVG